MLIEPRHDLDEIARPVTIIELVHQNVVPGIAAGARRTRQAEDVGRAGDTRGGAGLDRRRADLAVAHHEKQRRKSLHALFEKWLYRFGSDVASGEPGAPGSDDDIDGGIC